MFYTDPKSKKSKPEPALHGPLCCLVVFVSHSKTFFHMGLVNWSSWAGHTGKSPISGLKMRAPRLVIELTLTLHPA